MPTGPGSSAFDIPAELLGNRVDDRWLAGDTALVVEDKFSGHVVAEVSAATRAQVTAAVSSAFQAVERGAPPPDERAAVLRRAAELLTHRQSQFIDVMIGEAGFTQADAAAEVERATITLAICAEECPRLLGELVPFAVSPGAHQRFGYTLRFPIGVVCAITPFNSPLNTVLHKVAPAYASGNSVVLKPSALTPLTAALLTQLLVDAGMASGFLQLVQGDGETVGNWLLEDPRIAFYAFTGSTRVGRLIQQAAGLRRTQMELGSIASTFICDDGDLARAIPKIAAAAFRKAGQVCTSVQRLYVHSSRFEEACERLVAAAADYRAGDPRDPAVRVGPLISEAAARRVEDWLGEARGAGASVLCGGVRTRSVIAPTLLRDVMPSSSIWCREAFAPLLALRRFDDFDAAMADANSTPYGLSAGVFTKDIDRAMKAARTLRFGTIQINETSSARADVMPFGGVKDSGFGKEGPRYAMREMTEERLVTINP